MHCAGKEVRRATEALKSSTLEAVSQYRERPSTLGYQRGPYDESCEASICRRWPVWAINTCVSMSKHASRDQASSAPGSNKRPGRDR